jgi:hypothetical protein
MAEGCARPGAEPGGYDRPDIPAIHQDHGEQSGNMDEQIENQSGFMETEKLLQKSQVPRTADGQEFR